MSNQVRIVKTAVTAALAMAATTAFAQGSDSTWDFEITPYLWGVGIDSDVTIRGREAEVDTDFDDVFDRVDFTGSLLGIGHFGKFVTFTQLDFISTDTDELDFDDQPVNGGRFENDTFFGTLAFGYQFGSSYDRRSLDLLLGARIATFDPEVRLPNGQTFNADSKDVVDPVLLARPSFRFAERWRFNPTFAIGGGDDSDLIYELQPQLQFQITENVAARFGYRKLFYDFESDSSNGLKNAFDGSFEGFIIGLGGTFGSGPIRVTESAPPPQPVAAAAPPPPPPAPPPGDGDRDGVADNIDKCPSTAPSVPVDSLGCGFNTTLAVNFETDSAVLTPESHTELDRIVEVFNSTSHISGYVEGYTDSTGSNGHNSQLSQRRADAVADYLISHGVNRARVIPKGYGENNPVADNNTPEGRAQNRRVVLKRIDSEK